MDATIKAARATGADVVVTPFFDPIGLDAVTQLPGSVMTQIYWHTTAPSFPSTCRSLSIASREFILFGRN
jgi:hypothetical protein